MAAVLDLFLVNSLTNLLGAVFGVQTVTSGSVPAPGFPITGAYSSTTSMVSSWAVGVGVLVAYFLVFEMLFGRTPGKAFTGLRVVRVDGARAGAWAVLVRNLARPLEMTGPLIVLGAGLVLLSASHRRIGDRLGGTTVVTDGPLYRDADPPRARTPRLLLLGGLLALSVAGLLAFSYWARPPLVIQGLSNTGMLFENRPTSYELGSPAWGNGKVVYPVRFTIADGRACHGSVALTWTGPLQGWIPDSAESTCP